MQAASIVRTEYNIGEKSGRIKTFVLNMMLNSLKQYMVCMLGKSVGDMKPGSNKNISEYMNKSKLNWKYTQINTTGFNKSKKEINLKTLSSWASQGELFSWWNELPHSCLKLWAFCPFRCDRYLATREGPCVKKGVVCPSLLVMLCLTTAQCFSCQVCSFSFLQKSVLNKKIASVHCWGMKAVGSCCFSFCISIRNFVVLL